MLPEKIVGRYRRYKRGTRRLIYWLVKVVSERGRIEDVLGTASLAPPEYPHTSKPKHGNPAKKGGGKKQKQKQKRKQGEARIDEKSSTQLELKAHQLVDLARDISTAEPPVRVTESVLATVQEVIRDREACHEWYSAQALKSSSPAGQDGAEKDAAPKTTSSRTSKASENVADTFNNLFEYLLVEEPSDDPLGAEAPALTIKTATGDARVQVKLEQHEDDSAFQIWCFLNDLSDIRKTIKGVWQRYADGDTSFLNAGLVTETAFGLLRRADEDFRASNPLRSTDWQETVAFLGLGYFVHKDTVWLHPTQAREGQDPSLTEGEANITELLCPIAFLGLHDLRLLMQHFCKVGKDQSSKASLTSLTSLKLDMYCMHPVTAKMYRACVAAHEDAHTPGLEHIIMDEFLAGLTDMHRSGQIRMWTVVALQIYQDIHDLLSEQVFRQIKATHTIHDNISSLMVDIEAYQRSSESLLDDVQGEVQDLNSAERRAHRHKDDAETTERVPGTKSSTCKPCLPELALPASMSSRLAGFRLFLYSVSVDFMLHGTS